MLLAMSLARDGSSVCTADGALLHSGYDPAREAERFIDSRLGSSKPSSFILLGPCLDYLSPIIRRRFPASRIVSLQFSPFFRGRELGSADATWYPDDPFPVFSFLDANLGEELSSGLAVLEWSAASRAFPDIAHGVDRAVRDFLGRHSATAATVKASGRSWILNACRTFLLVEELLEPRPFEGPVVVAMAGPSLEESLSALAPLRGAFRLVSVSSALSACLASGLVPDLAIATDGGFWSRAHLYPLSGREVPLCMPLTALPSACLSRRSAILLLDQGSFAEAELLPLLGGGLVLPAHGTVAGSALTLAARSGQGPVIAAGLDLACRGESEHARPHGFDQAVGGASRRLRPLETSAFARRLEAAPIPVGGGWHGSRSHAVYAAALSQDAASLPGRLHRLNPSPCPLDGFKPIGARELEGIIMTSHNAYSAMAPLARRAAPPYRDRRAFLGRKLGEWRSAAEAACARMAEGLEPDPRIVELLRAFDHPLWAAARRAAASGADPRPAALALGARVMAGIDDIEGRLLS